MDCQEHIGLKEAADNCGVSIEAFQCWLKKGRRRTFTFPEGPAVLRDELRACFEQQGLPQVQELEPGPKLMVVEDEPGVSRLVVKILRGIWPFATIRTVDDGLKAAEQIQTFRPGLLLMDLGLPGLGGLELCRITRDSRELSHTKVLVVTGDHDRETNQEALDSGADEFLTKPFNVEELRRSVIRLLA